MEVEGPADMYMVIVESMNDSSYTSMINNVTRQRYVKNKLIQ